MKMCVGLVVTLGWVGLNSCPQVDNVIQEWRQATIAEFGTQNQFLRKIITDGEDAQHLPDFLQRFNDQNMWLDRTLRGTQRVGDENYNKIVDKLGMLRSLIVAQKKADEILKKIRLFSLYELNALAKKKQYRIELSDQEIKSLVSRVTSKLPGLEQKPVQQTIVDDLQREIKEQLKLKSIAEEKVKLVEEVADRVIREKEKFLEKKEKEAHKLRIEVAEKEKYKELERELSAMMK